MKLLSTPAPDAKPVGGGAFAVGVAFGLMSSPMPLALAMYRNLLSALRASAVGYQPVGILPSSAGRRGLLISSTATEFRPASATYRRVLSETASALGYDPCTGGPSLVVTGSNDRGTSEALYTLGTAVDEVFPEFPPMFCPCELELFTV